MTSTPPSINSPRRRVLADKSTNASLSASISPVRKRNSKAATPKNKTHRGVTGHKRTISQVEDFEQRTQQRSGHTYSDHDIVRSNLTQNSRGRDDETSSTKLLSNQSQPLNRSLSFHASQEPEVELEEAFDIQDEVLGDSQVEKLVRLSGC